MIRIRRRAFKILTSVDCISFSEIDFDMIGNNAVMIGENIKKVWRNFAIIIADVYKPVSKLFPY